MARVLVDSVEFVGLSTIRPNLVTAVRAAVAAGEITQPAMLVAALSIEDLAVHPSGARPVAFESFSLGDPISATPGSEGFIGNLIRDLLRIDPPSTGLWLPPATSLETLRQARCRSIVIVTDYSGSGTQLREYAKTIVRHPTVRSWRSGGRIRIHAVAFAATPSAIELLGRPGTPIDGFRTVQAARSFRDRPWTTSERSAVESLCKRYARREYRRDALGYKSTSGLFATDESVPNNLPAVLRQRGGDWHPFFDGRTVPPQLAIELGDYAAAVGFNELMETAGQSRLARVAPTRNTRVVSTKLVQVLALLSMRAHSPAEVAGRTGDNLQQVDRLLGSLASLGLIDERRHLTAAGRAELHAARRGVRRVEVALRGSDEAYYPATMR